MAQADAPEMENMMPPRMRASHGAGTAFAARMPKIQVTLPETIRNREAEGAKLGLLLHDSIVLPGTDAFERVLALGPDPDFKDGKGRTALMKLAEAGDCERALKLLQAGAGRDVEGPGGMKAADFAMKGGNMAMVKLLEEWKGLHE